MTSYGLVLTAAGSSRRFGGDTSKVLLLLGGVPVVARAAAAFRAALGTLPTVLTARADDLEALRALARRDPALAGAVVVEGGATRQESVARGVASLPPGLDVVLVHDAARPLVTPDLVRRVADAAARDGAAAPALPVRDSVHRADPSGRLVETLDREALRTVQTPQAARAALLRRALDLAEQRGTVATDEVALLVAAGIPVTAVAGDPDNVKLTVPADLTFARNVLEARRDLDAPDDVVPR
ncbi:MAG: 2-C-methyl-D-erythritol 4-phosphate cytidylyltransferase [Planctomycetia bacterium]|nr:2-C-methyl-D-erythritol 4-phosphate cytidylyltransferase [Planctomycetia bacterium]